MIKFVAGTGEDPFARVKDLIAELINRLLSKVSSEASHESYCDYEWAKAYEKKTNLKTQVATRSSKLETVVLESCVLEGKFAELQADLGALSGQQLKMDAMRADEREIFATTKEDLEHEVPVLPCGRHARPDDTQNSRERGEGRDLAGVARQTQFNQVFL